MDTTIQMDSMKRGVGLFCMMAILLGGLLGCPKHTDEQAAIATQQTADEARARDEAELRQKIALDMEASIHALVMIGHTKSYIESVYTSQLSAWQKAADLGWPEGQFLVADCYYEGVGFDKDYSAAARLLQMSAEQGYAPAQRFLGLMYSKGEGVLQDETKGAKWVRKAADQGGAMDQVHLGRLYYRGEGVLKDRAEAVKWYRKASKQGLAEAQCDLAYAPPFSPTWDPMLTAANQLLKKM